MSYVIIPVQPLANQVFQCVLENLPAQISLTTTDYGLYADIIFDGAPVANARLCLDRTDINPMRYNGLPQALFFADTQGTSDPTFEGFGTRYLLCYGNPPGNAQSGIGFVFGSTGQLDYTFILNQSFLG